MKSKRNQIILGAAMVYALTGLAYGAPVLKLEFQTAQLVGSLRRQSAVIARSHPSQFNREAGYITHSIATADKQKLSAQPIGGIASHHIPTAVPLLAQYYAKLQKTRSVETFIVIGPDHFERGRGFSISEFGFQTPFGTIPPDTELIRALKNTGLVVTDEMPFDDHAVHSQTLFISKLFPQAKIVSILIRSDTSTEQGTALGETIAQTVQKLNRNVFIIGSVDFSHYLPEEQARPLDEASARLVGSLDPQLAGLAEADSPVSLSAVVAAVKALGATKTVSDQIYNSAQYSTLRDFTTGYVFDYFVK